jgi:putative superfamily III holin-X
MENETVQSSQESPALAELVSRLLDDLKLLTRQEVQLAKHELGERVSDVQRQVLSLALGIAALAAGVLVLLAAGVLVLSLIMPAWGAALLVGVAVSSLGATLLLAGKAKLAHTSLKPERTIQDVRQDMAAIKRAAT